MNILALLQSHFRPALEAIAADPAKLAELLDMIRLAQDAKFGDYQANFAMPLGKQLGKSPRDVAADVVARANVADLCETPEIAGPGFINLRVRDDVLVEQARQAIGDERLGVARVAK